MIYSDYLYYVCIFSGKTEWTKRLLINMKEMFEGNVSTVLYCYKHWQRAYEEIKAALGEKVDFLSDMPTEAELKTRVAHSRSVHGSDASCLLVVDDYMDEICTNPFFLNLLTRMSHHNGLVNIFIVQEGSLYGPLKRQILRNIHVTIYMSTARDRAGLRNLALLLNDYQCVMQAFDDASEYGRGSYLCVDTHPDTDLKYRYRTKIFPPDGGTVVYRSKKK